MNKNKEWAKGQLEYYIKAVGIPFNSCTQGMIDAYKNVEHIINQLDEPEMSGKIDIEKLKGWIREHNDAEYPEDMSMTLINAQQTIDKIEERMVKPVIPQFVADYIEKWKHEGLTIYEWLSFGNNDVDEDIYKWLYYSLNEKNRRREYLLIDAIRYGYEVEKEKRYYIIDKTNNSTLMTFELSDVVGEEIIEFVDGYSENETIHFNSKEKAKLIAHFVGESLEVEEVTE